MDNKKNLIAKLLKPLIGFLVLMLAFEIILFELLSHGFLNTLVAMIIQIIVIAAIFGLLTSFILSLLHPFLAAIRGKEAPAESEKQKEKFEKFAQRDDALGEAVRTIQSNTPWSCYYGNTDLQCNTRTCRCFREFQTDLR